jgi:hypothetical protein
MFEHLITPIAFLIGLTLWLAIRHVVRAEQDRRQHEVAARGEFCQGRVVAIQRPFFLDTSTRLYFEFAPPGVEQPMRCCHVDRRPPDEISASLPSAGTVVTVRYLPEQPSRAVIGKLVSSFS